jgi:predicted dehydrogenase
VTPLPTLIIGYGNMGTKHARVLRELGGVDSVWGVVDPSEDRRRRATFDNPKCRTFPGMAEALAALRGGDRPACATIAASTPLHFEIAKALVEERIPTLVEKPIASTSQQGKALAELAEARQTILTVGHVERFNPAAVAARKLVSDKIIGDVIQMSFRRVGGSPADTSTLQDVLVDLAVHDFDLARFITGSNLEIVDAAGHLNNGRLDSALVLGRLGTGAGMQLQVNWRTPVKIRRIELTGTSGYLEINLITQQVTLYRQNPLLAEGRGTNPDAIPYFDSYLLSFSSPDKVELGIERREPLLEELGAFWRAVASGHALPITAEDAVIAVELTEEARRRMNTHDKVP